MKAWAKCCWHASARASSKWPSSPNHRPWAVEQTRIHPMGMNVGSSSSSGEPEVLMDINTTPLIDVMLVLLVMLIITIPIQLHSVNLEMPVGTPPANMVKPEKIKIDINEQSVIFWQGLPVSAQELEDKMKEIALQPWQP